MNTSRTGGLRAPSLRRRSSGEPVQSATSLRTSPTDDRRKRTRNYTITMSVRTICLILVLVVPDWWKLVFGIGAIVLPYVAVILANVGSTAGTDPIRPGAPVPLALEARSFNAAERGPDGAPQARPSFRQDDPPE